MRLIDSHCHIDGEQFDSDRDQVIERAREAGVVAMLDVGTGDPHSGEIERAVEAAARYETVFATVGVHPHDAKLYDFRAEDALLGLVSSSNKVLAWGEIGLDYYYEHSPRDIQRDVFRRQIRKAKELQLPIVVHSRNADSDTLEILTDEYPVGTGNGIMHCFGGSPQTAAKLLALGFLISFAGNVTFKKAENLREAARVVPLDKVLVETDCPFLTPEPLRGKRNEPSFVVHTARFLAEFYGTSFEELAEQTTRNFLDFFKLDLS